MKSLWNALASALNIRSGEGNATVLLLAHSFCLGLTSVSFTTAASALFLAAFDVGMLPYVYIGSAGVAVLTGFLYTRLQSRLPFATLLIVTLLFLVLTISAFRLGLWLTDSKWLAFGLLFWLRMIIVLANLEFWGLAGRLFNIRQGKRLFGLIGSGELAASILGGFAIPVVVVFTGTPNLLLFAVLGLFLALGFLLLTVRRFASQLTSPQERGEPAEQRAGSKLSELLRSRYTVLIIASNVLMVMVYSFIDYTFYDYTKLHYQGDMHLAMFLGPFFAVVQIINVLTKTFVAGRLFSRYGLRFGLLVHPLLLIVASVLIAGSSTIWSGTMMLFALVALLKLCDEVFWTSIYDPSLLVLYQPLQTAPRRAIQIAVQSIFGPLAIGASGIVLLLLGATDFFTSVHLMYVIPFILAGAIFVARHMNREYIGVLTQALTKRTLTGVDLALSDKACTMVLEHKLQSPHPGEVLYALDLLERSGHPSLEAFLSGLLEHPNAAIRQEVLRRIETNRDATALAAVRQHLTTEDLPAVRAAALRALSALGETDSVEEVSPYLHDKHPEIRLGAMVGLLRYGGIEGILAAGECLILAAHDPDPAQRQFAAQGLGEVGMPSFYQPLVPLLHDAELEVRRTAIAAAGNIRHPKLWPYIVEQLASPEAGAVAATALVAGGDAALPELMHAFAAPQQERRTLVRIARICGRMRGEQAMAFLRTHLDVPDVIVRHRVLVALSQCGYRARDGDPALIRQHLTAEVEEAAWAFAALVDIGDTPDVSVMQAALQHEIDRIHRRLFLWLSFLYDAQAVLRAWDHLADGATDKRAYALEIIDVLVAQDLKVFLFPVIDDLPLTQRLHSLHERFPQRRIGCQQRLREIVARSGKWTHPWTRACALYTMAQLADATFVDDTVAALPTSDALIQETALWALYKLAPDIGRHHAAALWQTASPQVARLRSLFEPEDRESTMMLTTVEKVIILKTVSIFADLPADLLAEMASLLDDVAVAAGETIIEKGDIGTCLYIIVDGLVQVHDGERRIAQLGEREVFGELAVLDPEPRSASVTAIDDARLFRLDQDAMYDLMADRVEVARGIIRVLCRALRLRTATGPASTHNEV